MLTIDTFLLFDLFFWAFAGLLVAAALLDVWRFVIPNWISLALVGLFAVALLAHPAPIDWLTHLAAMGLVLAAMLLLYRFRIVGGGDLKLLTAVGLWVGLEALPMLLLWIAVAGGVLALGLIVLRRLISGVLVAQPFSETVRLPRLLLPGESIPYGIAIAAGGLWVSRSLPHLGQFV